jgi:hypothetical protein
VRWFVWADGATRPVRIPHTSMMRGQWGWDATCSCGWESRTGGATRGSVEKAVWGHKFDVATDAERDRLVGVVR